MMVTDTTYNEARAIAAEYRALYSDTYDRLKAEQAAHDATRRELQRLLEVRVEYQAGDHADPPTVEEADRIRLQDLRDREPL